MHASLRKELGARHSLLNLSVYDLVEECVNSSGLSQSSSRNYPLYNNSATTVFVRISPVIDTLTVTPIKDDDNLLNTIDSHIKLRKLKEVMLLCWIIKLLSIPSADKYSKKHLKVCEADASKQVDANVREEGNKNRSSLYYSDSNSDTATEKTRIKARERKARSDSLLDSNDYCLDSSSNINPKDNLEDEEATTAKDFNERQSLCESRDGNRTLHSRRLIGAYILYFKELLSDNSRIFASVIGITRTQAIVLSAIIGYVHFKN
ncbi:hypothetical protein HBI95_032960 [Parastagonospora nodorum]|nr:hypothetical protein HBI95_032960 [Parastagonospora nodorum]